uniref:Uncharacterized protein n=1 Tax=Candidatus Kentrum sp. LPFa TaxID=2126335 RepID=A0A450XMX7_9GAMM|nr:MAG: hypothetical protein BECKLPF1236C_GA0070990_101176 [Candidatus Kentron sp. LPFa]
MLNPTILKRQQQQKELLLQQLKKTPIIQIACEKIQLSRATYYRWRKEDTEFQQAIDQALSEGTKLINDLAESQLLTAIRNNKMPAIIFWLKHHHQNYSNKVQISGELKTQNQELSPEQENLMKQALRLAGLPEN